MSTEGGFPYGRVFSEIDDLKNPIFSIRKIWMMLDSRVNSNVLIAPYWPSTSFSLFWANAELEGVAWDKTSQNRNRWTNS